VFQAKQKILFLLNFDLNSKAALISFCSLIAKHTGTSINVTRNKRQKKVSDI